MTEPTLWSTRCTLLSTVRTLSSMPSTLISTICTFSSTPSTFSCMSLTLSSMPWVIVRVSAAAIRASSCVKASSRRSASSTSFLPISFFRYASV
ncbi:hypothetical protein H4582DRAFT_2025858 [Lactarius indigo]|nr:hypothetical protein H4582DRAFT_2025858 [Lactarius indigo]